MARNTDHTYAHDMMWDEDRGGPRTEFNLVSFPRNGTVHKATIKAMPWSKCGAHDEERVVVPAIFIEKLTRYAYVPDPYSLDTHLMLEKCLGVNEYLAQALQILIDHDLLKCEDEEGDQVDKVFEGPQDLQEAADKIVKELIDHPSLHIKTESFEWLEAFDDAEQRTRLSWLHNVTLADVTKNTNDLTVYIDLTLALGPRSTAEIRKQPGSTIDTMAGGPNGGQLIQAVKAHYYPSSATGPIDPNFLKARLVDFLVESKWPGKAPHPCPILTARSPSSLRLRGGMHQPGTSEWEADFHNYDLNSVSTSSGGTSSPTSEDSVDDEVEVEEWNSEDPPVNQTNTEWGHWWMAARARAITTIEVGAYFQSGWLAWVGDRLVCNPDGPFDDVRDVARRTKLTAAYDDPGYHVPIRMFTADQWVELVQQAVAEHVQEHQAEETNGRRHAD